MKRNYGNTFDHVALIHPYKTMLLCNVEGYERFIGYAVGQDGIIWSCKHRNRFRHWSPMKPKIADNGYHRISINNNNYKKELPIHRLVALCFIPNPDNKPYINHINGIKTDNDAKNLEWVTTSENLKHAYDTGLKPKYFGEDHWNNKVTKEQENEIKQKRATGVPVKQLMSEYNIGRTSVWRIVNNKTWHKVHNINEQP